jgi:hypothetical protein
MQVRYKSCRTIVILPKAIKASGVSNDVIQKDCADRAIARLQAVNEEVHTFHVNLLGKKWHTFHVNLWGNNGTLFM